MTPRLLRALLLGIGISSTTVWADDQRFNLDLPAGALSTAVESLASQAGLQLLFDRNILAGQQVSGLHGHLSAREALDKLLAGSGISYSFTGKDTVALNKQRGTGTSETFLEQIVVTATRTEQAIDDVPASVSVISAADIKMQQAIKIEDLLRQTESIDINASPGTGSPGSISLRGIGGSFAGQTTAILVGGLATDSPISGVMGRGGLSFIAEQDIERIEIVRGPASALYGPNVVGGVINAIPKRWKGELGAEVLAEVGSHDSKKLGAAVGLANEVFDFRVSTYDFRTDGFKPMPEPDPWGSKDLDNRDWKEKKSSLRGGVRPSKHQEITFDYSQYSTDAAYLGGRPNARQKFQGDALSLGYRHEFGDTATLKLAYRQGKVKQRALFDQDYWNGDPGNYDLASVLKRATDTNTLEAQTDFRLASNNTLSIGASRQDSTYKWRTQDVGSEVPYSQSKSRLTGAFIQDEHRFDKLTVIVGGRYDHISMFGDKDSGVAADTSSSDNTFNPRLGLRYYFTDTTSLYGSAGTAYVPASNSLKFMGNPARWLDNPNLKPETSTSYEIGLNHQNNWANMRLSVYRTDYKDKISSIAVGTLWQYQNLGKVTVDGVELEIQGKLEGGWNPYLNYAYTDSIIKKNPSDPSLEGKRTQRIAPNKLNLGLVYAPSSRWEARVGGRYVSARYFTDQNTPEHEAGSYFVMDAKVSTQLPLPNNLGKWDAYLAVNNLLDRKYTEWEYEYADRRNFWLGLNGSF